MNKYFVLGTNSSISFGDHFLGLWTFFSAIKKYDIGSDNPNFILGLKNKKISFLSKWFPSIENVIFLEKDHCLINYINIHLHSKHFINQSRDCPYGYFINHNLNPNDMISPTITGNEIEEVKNAKCILFKDMGEYTGLSLDYDYVEYLKNKTGCIVNEEHLMGYDLGDVLYTIYKNDIPVIAYRNGLCDFLYFVAFRT